ncbi:MAG: RNA-binding S4 domain-containing protein [Gammaproteobacteria bacterium]|nr:RNA-binding S4 domain-containing protein [Gammaproteobacteria bacterium]
MNKVLINREPVELFKLLKFEGLAATGGEAKIVIDEGLVTVNGQPEMRKRRKMMSGDVFEFEGESYLLELE